MSRGRILDAVWGADFLGESNIIDRHVRSLRAKLQDDYRKPRFIETVAGAGYRFVVVQAQTEQSERPWSGAQAGSSTSAPMWSRPTTTPVASRTGWKMTFNRLSRTEPSSCDQRTLVDKEARSDRTGLPLLDRQVQAICDRISPYAGVGIFWTPPTGANRIFSFGVTKEWTKPAPESSSIIAARP